MQDNGMIFKDPFKDFVAQICCIAFFFILGIITWLRGNKLKDRGLMQVGICTIIMCWCWPFLSIIWGFFTVICLPAWISDLYSGESKSSKPPEENNGRYN